MALPNGTIRQDFAPEIGLKANGLFLSVAKCAAVDSAVSLLNSANQPVGMGIQPLVDMEHSIRPLDNFIDALITKDEAEKLAELTS